MGPAARHALHHASPGRAATLYGLTAKFNLVAVPARLSDALSPVPSPSRDGPGLRSVLRQAQHGGRARGGCAPARKLRPESVCSWTASATHEQSTGPAADPAQAEGTAGAGEGNRTLVISLEGCCSTIELHPQEPECPRPADQLQQRA